MPATRPFKNVEWVFEPGAHGGIQTWEQAQVAILMDIRNELKSLNALLHCSNFTGIPSSLRIIARQTRPNRRKKVTK